MKNISQMMQQAQEMQSKMADIQDKLSHLEIEGSSGAGLIKVTLSGKNDVRRIKIDALLCKRNTSASGNFYMKKSSRDDTLGYDHGAASNTFMKSNVVSFSKYMCSRMLQITSGREGRQVGLLPACPPPRGGTPNAQPIH